MTKKEKVAKAKTKAKKISKYKLIHDELEKTGQPLLQYAKENEINHGTLKSGLSLYRRLKGIKVKRGRPMGVKNKSLKAENHRFREENEKLRKELEECNGLLNLSKN